MRPTLRLLRSPHAARSANTPWIRPHGTTAAKAMAGSRADLPWPTGRPWRGPLSGPVQRLRSCTPCGRARGRKALGEAGERRLIGIGSGEECGRLIALATTLRRCGLRQPRCWSRCRVGEEGDAGEGGGIRADDWVCRKAGRKALNSKSFGWPSPVLPTSKAKSFGWPSPVRAPSQRCQAINFWCAALPGPLRKPNQRQRRRAGRHPPVLTFTKPRLLAVHGWRLG